LQDNASENLSFFQFCESLCSVAIKNLIANGSFGNHTSPIVLSNAELVVLSQHFGNSLLERLQKIGFKVNRQSLDRKLTAKSITNGRKDVYDVKQREKINTILKAPVLYLLSNSSPSPSPIVEVDSFATVSAYIL
jgi:hypothetical protein